MSHYWTLAEAGQPLEKDTAPNVRDRPLEDDDCLVYRTREDLMRSDKMDEVVAGEEDLAPRFEVVETHAKAGSESPAFSGLGLYIKVQSTGGRSPLLEWLQGVARSDDSTDAEAANDILELYRVMREAFEFKAP